MRYRIRLLTLGLLAGTLSAGCQGLSRTPSSPPSPRAALLKKERSGDLAWYNGGEKAVASPGVAGGRTVLPSMASTSSACSSCSTTVAIPATPESIVQLASPPPATIPLPPTAERKSPGFPEVTSEAIPPAPVPPNGPPSIETLQTVSATTLPLAPSSSAPVDGKSNLGPGVEVVSGGMIQPAGPAPGEQVVSGQTISVRFGPSNDYRTLVGQVYQFRRTWRLRYTAVESDDRHGGSVILVGDQLDDLKNGQMVRVEGVVISQDDRGGGTRYQVNRLQVIEPGQ